MKIYRNSSHIFIPKKIYSMNLYENHLICVYIVNHPDKSVDDNLKDYFKKYY